MTITFTKPPEKSLEICKDALASFPEVTDAEHKMFLGGAQEELVPKHAHEVFTTSVDDLAGGKGLDQAKAVAWRYLVESQGKVEGSVEVALHEGESGHEFSMINKGPFNQATLEALNVAEQSDVAQKESPKLAFLRIPALYVMALWLRSENPENDIFIPLAPTHQDLEPGKEYSREAFLSIMEKAAQETSAKEEPVP